MLRVDLKEKTVSLSSRYLDFMPKLLGIHLDGVPVHKKKEHFLIKSIPDSVTLIPQIHRGLCGFSLGW